MDFLVIGAGIAGLASAIALRRVGHRVSVLERHDSVTKVRRSNMVDVSHSADDELRFIKATGGCRMPPNLTKILFHWGLEKELLKIALKSQGIALNLCKWSGVLLCLGNLFTHH